MDRCGSGEKSCVYSHSRAHLPTHGWWATPLSVGITAARNLYSVVENKEVDYSAFFDAARIYHQGHGYSARRRRELLCQYLQEQLDMVMLGRFFGAGEVAGAAAATPAAAAETELFVLVMDFDYEGYMDGLHKALFNAMTAKIKLVHVRVSSKRRGPEFTLERLTNPQLKAVLVTDRCYLQPHVQPGHAEAG